MMMTKKDYIKFAAAIARARGYANREENVKGILYTLELELADIFAQDNPHFKRGLFLDACEKVIYE